MAPKIYKGSSNPISPLRGLLLFVYILSFFLFIFSSPVHAANFYSRSNGEWTDPNTWGADTCGDLLSSGSIPGPGDNVYICDGYIVTMSGLATCENLIIGGGVSGLLQFGFSENTILTVLGDINVNLNAVFQYAFNASKRHRIHLSGNFINKGNVNLGFDNDDYVVLTFKGSGKSMVSGNGIWTSLGYMTLDKENKAAEVHITSKGFGNTITSSAARLSTPKSVGKNPPVVLICGTFIYDIPDNLSNLINPGASGDPSFTIPRNVVFRVEKGTVDMATFPGIGEMGDCVLEGELIVNGGTVTISKNTRSSWNTGLLYCGNAPETPKLVVNNGAINCYGPFTSWTSNKDDIDFTMGGGIFTVNMGLVSTEMETFWITDHPGSAVDFSGGTVIIQNKSTHAASFTFSDFDLGGPNIGNRNVSGRATVQFGNESSAAAQVMRYSTYADVINPHLVQYSAAEPKAITVKPFSVADHKLLSYND